jgi:hypothetical protein
MTHTIVSDFRSLIPGLRWNTMRVNNTKSSSRTVAAICILITLSLLLMSAGCVDSSQKNSIQNISSENPASTCSAEANVCPVDLPVSLTIDASPQLYSPIMSSTVGIGLTPNVSGLKTAGVEYEWTATYGHFLDWSAPNYTVNTLSEPVVNDGEKIYWSFTEVPKSSLVPVVITVTEREITSKKTLASSRLTLGWKNNMTVAVEKIE